MSDETGVTITWLGHASTLVETGNGTRILIDPWLEGNPATPDEYKGDLPHDLLLITHGHFDHMADAVRVATQANSDVISNFEICNYLGNKGVKNCNGINQGGTVHWNGIDITLTEAVHSSGIAEGDQILYGGLAGGFVVRFPDGFTLYHAGDTAVFSGMQLIGDLYRPDVALLPIGGHFTMGPREAATAIRMLSVTRVIPIHFGTFPLLAGSPDQIRQETQHNPSVRIVELQPGDSIVQRDLMG